MPTSAGRAAPSRMRQASGARAPLLPLAPTLRPESTAPAPSPYVANICFKCFRCFGGVLQVFHMDVAKVDRDGAYVASFSFQCFICFSRLMLIVCLSGCCICFTHMFASVLSECCVYFCIGFKCFSVVFASVLGVCFKCFICI